MDFFSDRGFLEYQTHQFSYLQVNGTGDCAAVILGPDQDKGLLKHYFLPCSTKLPALCMGDGIKEVLHTESRNWTESVLACDGLLRGSFDGFYNLSNPPSNFTMAWTGIFRRSKLQWSTGNETAPFECLVVSKKNKSVVSIQTKNCSDLLPSLCEREEITIKRIRLETTAQSMGLETITQSMELITYSGTPPEESTQQEIRSFADYNQCHPDDNGVTILAIGSTLIIISGLFFLVSSVILWKARNMTKSMFNYA
ncbi:uncharacterized protein LOC134240545 [Saccostrea cucullata]|uniref:uncharacterized protein LOC134240545 n=1 Tax=Saccostrea cuccullata TaxID=36930 RepID=UPI002ED3D343